jgi:hypothetical protein
MLEIPPSWLSLPSFVLFRGLRARTSLAGISVDAMHSVGELGGSEVSRGTRDEAEGYLSVLL